MDYEKKYKAVLEQARDYYNRVQTDYARKELENIFPELHESEDERIRKWLIDYFGSIKEVVWIHRDITCEQILAYLEKQKEQKPTDDKAFEEWIDDWYQGSKEAGGDVVMSEAEFKNWSRGIRNMYQYKPAEWSEEDETIIEGACNALEIHGHTKLASMLKSLRPSWKPSEDEERLINTSISFLKDFADKGYENAVECIDWLKSKLNGNSGK